MQVTTFTCITFQLPLLGHLPKNPIYHLQWKRSRVPDRCCPRFAILDRWILILLMVGWLLVHGRWRWLLFHCTFTSFYSLSDVTINFLLLFLWWRMKRERRSREVSTRLSINWERENCCHSRTGWMCVHCTLNTVCWMATDHLSWNCLIATVAVLVKDVPQLMARESLDTGTSARTEREGKLVCNSLQKGPCKWQKAKVRPNL